MAAATLGVAAEKRIVIIVIVVVAVYDGTRLARPGERGCALLTGQGCERERKARLPIAAVKVATRGRVAEASELRVIVNKCKGAATLLSRVTQTRPVLLHQRAVHHAHRCHRHRRPHRQHRRHRPQMRAA